MNDFELINFKNKKLEQEKFNEILTQTNIGNLDKKLAIEVLHSIPNIIELQKNYLDSIKNIIESVKSTQISALEGISIKNFEKLYEIVERISKDGSEDLKKECINKIFELAKLELEYEKQKNITLENINNSNNSLWKKLPLV
ncbi:hypothetical protein FE243_03590 [Aliarcobacter thereius]|uniref:hypothetical protein n=1 Tax=Aliarcobacter thereius TaxID=544718 RepID=UPI0010FE3FCB|nr:hypothetical protein [Aliarcobacter thereius]TLT07830.1 hypothetical protein FE243_03590 [Aliarcobacter thereius]